MKQATSLALPFQACLSSCRSKDCTKNHFIYYEDKLGYHVNLELVHYKNASTKGKITLPMSPRAFKLLTHLEQGREACFPNAPSLFLRKDGNTFSPTHFSMYCANLLTLKEGLHVHATALRHFFSSTFRDFLHSAHANMMEQAMKEMQAFATTLMLNSEGAWDATYDEVSPIAREMSSAMAMWQSFEKFVHEAHAIAKSKKPINPLSFDASKL